MDTPVLRPEQILGRHLTPPALLQGNEIRARSGTACNPELPCHQQCSLDRAVEISSYRSNQ